MVTVLRYSTSSSIGLSPKTWLLRRCSLRTQNVTLTVKLISPKSLQERLTLSLLDAIVKLYSAEMLSHALQVQRAVRLGSTDNITVIIIQLRELHPYEDSTAPPRPSRLCFTSQRQL